MPTSALITCGAAWEPIDGMRRLTNASTGQLGTLLAEAFGAAGFAVTMFRGETAIAPLPRGAVEIHTFSTNDDLARQLAQWHGPAPGVILHAAALCDFRVARASGRDGRPLTAGKLPTREGAITLELEPATKVLPQLPRWFPQARIVGWKYEVDGTAESALQAARRQLKEGGTHGCVVNGPAWGPGFGWVTPTVPGAHACATPAELAATLLHWIRNPDIPTS